MADTNEDPWKYKLIPFSINASVVLALVTAFAYSLAFTYEASYCEAFHIPTALINIDLALLTPFWTKVVTTVTGLFLFVSWLYYFVIRNVNKLVSYLIYSLLFVAFLRIIAESLVDIHFSWSFYGVLLLLSVSSSLLTLWMEKHSPARKPIGLEALATLSKEDRNKKLATVVRQMRVIIIVATALGIAFSYGYTINSAKNDAQKQQEFFVLTHQPNLVVLRIYGDKIIAGEYDNKTHLLTGKIVSYKFSDTTALEMEQKVIGPLINVPHSPFYIWNWKVVD